MPEVETMETRKYVQYMPLSLIVIDYKMFFIISCSQSVLEYTKKKVTSIFNLYINIYRLDHINLFTP